MILWNTQNTSPLPHLALPNSERSLAWGPVKTHSLQHGSADVVWEPGAEELHLAFLRCHHPAPVDKGINAALSAVPENATDRCRRSPVCPVGKQPLLGRHLGS